MSKKCPYIKNIIITDYECLGDRCKTKEAFGDCVEADCPFYTQDAGAPSFCIRAQCPDDDPPGTTRSIGFDALNNYGKS